MAENTLRNIVAVFEATERNGTVPRYAIVHTVGLAEGYIDTVLRSLISASDITHSALGSVMYSELQELMHRSWDERTRWLRRGFGIGIEGTKAQEEFMTLVELRNALVHGSGALTPRQSRKVEAVVDLEHKLQRLLDVGVGKDSFRFGPTTASRTARVARSFVLAIDRAVQESGHGTHF